MLIDAWQSFGKPFATPMTANGFFMMTSNTQDIQVADNIPAAAASKYFVEAKLDNLLYIASDFQVRRLVSLASSQLVLWEMFCTETLWLSRNGMY